MHMPLTAARFTSSIRSGFGLPALMSELPPAVRLGLRILVIANAFTGIGIVTHALLLGEIVPPVSITSAHGPERVPVDRLWGRSTESWDEDETPFNRRLTLLDQQIVEHGVQQPYIDRLVALFWLSVLSIVTAAYFSIRSLSLGTFEAFSRYVTVVLIPSAVLTLVFYQSDPRTLFLAWTAAHPRPCASAPIPPLN